MSQAAVFSLAASGDFAWSVALLLGIIFTTGMLAVDAANGLWVYRLIRSSEAGAILWSRGLTLAIGLLSLALALFGLVRLANTGLDHWYGEHALAIGCISMLLLALVWVDGFRRARSTP
jgi:nickel/cobalt transporter (NiCoT) family protein